MGGLSIICIIMKNAFLYIVLRILGFFLYVLANVSLSMLLVFAIFTSMPKEIKTDKKYTYVMKYRFANHDSTIIKYPAPRITTGKFINKPSRYEVTIMVGDSLKTFEINEINDEDKFFSLKLGDKVEITEKSWPSVTTIKNKSR